MDDHLPKLIDQADHHGWCSGEYIFPDESSQIMYFNPAIVQRKDGKFLITRKLELRDDPWGRNTLKIFSLNLPHNTFDYRVGQARDLKFNSSIYGQQDEDPRAFQYKDQTFLSCCSYYYYGEGQGWSGAHQIIASFDENWKCLQDSYPPIGGNVNGVHSVVTRNEKNWAWFMDKGTLCLAYSMNIPWTIVKFNRGNWDSYDTFEHPGIRWSWGTIRSGTSPVEFDGLYWSFFHSSLSWPMFSRRYYVGAVGFSTTPPYHPVFLSKKPMLSASDRDKTRPDKPLVLFPCGSILDKNKWLITMGVNDCYSAWVEIPHEDIIRSTARVTQL